MIAHEVAHKVAQDKSKSLDHSAVFQGWYALFLSKLVTGDQVDLYSRITASMARNGLTPVLHLIDKVEDGPIS
jgi:hypothetical protein